MGIGKTNPAVALDVVGSVRLRVSSGAVNYGNMRHDDHDLIFENAVTSAGWRGNILLMPNSSGAGGQGNVGIGTTSPFAKLSVAGDAYIGGNVTATGTLNVTGLTTLGNAILTSATTTNFFATTASSTNLFASNASTTLLSVSGTAFFPGSGIWNSSGNVGIGTVSPGFKLDVSGDIRATGIIRANSNNAVYFCGGDDACLFDVNVTNTVAIHGVQNSAVGTLQLGSGGARISGSGSNIGIGDLSPVALLTVGSGDLFQIISTGEARGITGAVGAPSFSFTGDTNTGMYSGGADILRLSTGGANRVTIDATGNIGIGTTTPGAKLDVVGTLNQSGGDLYLKQGASGENYAIRIGPNFAGPDTGIIKWSITTGGLLLDTWGSGREFRMAGSKIILGVSEAGVSAGNVGIGTTSPFAKLSVAGDAYIGGNVTATGTLSVTSLTTLGNATLTNATTTNLFSTTASSTNLFSSLATFGTLTLGNALAVSSGGTGLTTTPTFGQILRGTGSGYVLVATSTLGIALSDTTGTLPETRGGTNQTTYTTGDTLYASSANTLSKLSIGTTGFVLSSLNGVPTWVATTTLANISGTLAVGSGGTGATTLTGLLQGNGTLPITAITGTVGQFPYYSGTNTILATSSIFLATSGNVGIGTTDPKTKLQVGLEIIDDNSRVYDTNAPMFVHQTPTATAVLNDPEEVLYLGRQGTNGQAFGAMATFKLSRYENSSTNSRTRLDIDLTHSNFADANIMTLLSSGNVGIGTTTPGSKLSVAAGVSIGANYGVAAPTNGLIVEGNVGVGVTNPVAALSFANATGQKISFWDGSNDRYGMDVQSSELRIYSGAGGASTGGITFGKFNETTFTEAMRIRNDGNVGIGTTSPFAKLSVAGDAYIGGNLTATGTLNVTGLTTLGNAILTSATTTNFFATTASSTNLFASNASTTLLSVSGTAFFPGSGIWNSSGNVGIGTTTPGAKLTVSGGDIQLDNNRYLTALRADSTSQQIFALDSNNDLIINRGSIVAGQASSVIFGIGSNKVLQFRSSSNISLLSISESSGNVGIGTTTPGSKLSVAGDAYIGGNVTATGTLSVTGLTTLGNASTTVLSVSGNLFVTGTSSLTNTLNSGTLGVTGLTTLGNAILTNATTTTFFATTLGTNNEYFTDFTGSGLINTANALTCATANASTFGCLASSDWTTFNNKISSTSLSAGAGIAYDPSTGVITNTIGYPFIGNATSTLLTFSGGLISSASTTIGGGTQVTGLTIFGGATTTGNAYFAGNVGIGTVSPSTQLQVIGGVNIATSSTATPAFSVDETTGNVTVGLGSLTFSGIVNSNTAINLSNRNLVGANNIIVSDSGAGEGYSWAGTSAGWIVDVSPLARSNADGNLNLYGTANNVAIWRPTLFVFNASNYTTFTPQSNGGLDIATTGGNITFNPTGNLGIGTTSPFAKLSVAGDAYIGGNLTATGTLNVADHTQFLTRSRCADADVAAR